jgi:hypothetical protein
MCFLALNTYNKEKKFQFFKKFFCRRNSAFPAVFVYAENIVCGRDGRQNVSFVRQSVKNCPNAIVKEKRKGD